MKSPQVVTALAILATGLMIALAIFLRPVPDRYRFEVTDRGEVQRFDTVTGDVLACNGARCARLTSAGVAETD